MILHIFHSQRNHQGQLVHIASAVRCQVCESNVAAADAFSFGTPRLRAEGASSAGASCLAGIVPFGVARSSCADHEMSQCPAVNLRGQTDESTENLKLDKPKDAKVVACCGRSSSKLCQPPSIWVSGLHSALARHV